MSSGRQGLQQSPPAPRSRAVPSVAAALLIAGCATGPVFVAPEVPPPGRGIVYLYRSFALAGSGLTHETRVDTEPRGTLLNGSYLALPVVAGFGATVLSVQDCGLIVHPALRSRQVAYLEAVLVARTQRLGDRALADYRCQLTWRTEGEALPVLTRLRRAR